MKTHFKNFLGPGALCQATYLEPASTERSSDEALTELPERVTCDRCRALIIPTDGSSAPGAPAR